MNIKHLHFKELDSTNTYIKSRWDVLSNYTFVTTDKQTQGHGRYNRIWESNDGQNILCSFLIKDNNILKYADKFPALLPTSILKVLTHFGLEDVSIKWPNDIYVGDKKICGILMEANLPHYLVVGFGINVNQTSFSINTATSMKLEAKHNFVRLEVFQFLVNTIVKDIAEVMAGKNDYHEIFEFNNYLLDRTIKYSDKTGTHVAKVVGIDLDNYLMIEQDGKISSLNAGEVTLLK